MAGNRVTLVLTPVSPDRENISLSDFLASLDAFRDSLKGTERIVLGRKSAQIEWEVVSLSHSSPTQVVVEANGSRVAKKAADKVVRGFFGYMDQLTFGGKAPPELDRPTLRAFQRLSDPVQAERIRATILNGDASIEIVGSIGPLVETILAPRFAEAGSIDGRLEYVNVHGRRNIFRIWPNVGPERVQCVFPGALTTKAGGAVGRDVRVFGKFNYRERDDQPVSVLVEDIEILDAEDDLPSIMDIKGIASRRGMRGMSSEDYVRDQRGDW